MLLAGAMVTKTHRAYPTRQNPAQLYLEGLQQESEFHGPLVFWIFCAYSRAGRCRRITRRSHHSRCSPNIAVTSKSLQRAALGRCALRASRDLTRHRGRKCRCRSPEGLRSDPELPPAKPDHFLGFSLVAFRRRTPGPPPFSSMNSTPADSKARRTARSFAAVIEVSLSTSSARRIVATPTADSRARS